MAVAESLTGGLLSARISQGPGASDWFKGRFVAYQLVTKQRLLGISDGPVVSERCACEMAKGARDLLDSEVGIALTGVGGPGPAEGQEPGTVWIAVQTPDRPLSRLLRLRNRAPHDVCVLTCEYAVDLAYEALGSVFGF